MRRTCCAWLLAGLLVATGARGASAEDPRIEEVEILVEGAGLDLQTYLTAVSRQSGARLLWDPSSRELTGKTIAGPTTLRAPRDRLLDQARALLTFYDLVLVPVGPKGHETYLVLPAQRQAVLVRLRPEQVEITAENVDHYEGMHGLYVTAVIAAPHVSDLRELRGALTRLVTGQNIGNVQEVQAGRAFLVSDFAPNVAAIWRAVQTVDAMAAGQESGPVLRVLPLRHARAADVAQILQGHLETAPPVPGSPQAPPGAPPRPILRIQADARTNQVLVSGSPAQVERIGEALAALDVALPQAVAGVRIVRLEHEDPNRMAQTLQSLVRSAPASWGPAPPGLEVPTVMPFQGKGNAALLLRGSEEALAALLRVIQDLDREATAPRPRPGTAEPDAFVEAIGSKRVTLALQEQDLGGTIQALVDAGGVPIVASPLARRHAEDQDPITLHGKDVLLPVALDFVAAAYGLRWQPADGKIFLLGPQDRLRQ